MSKISTIYDRILTKMGSLFSTKTRIPNPYNVASNAQQYLDNGYGVAISSAVQTEGEWCSMVIEQTFDIIFTKRVFKNDTDPVMFDTAVKALREDVVTMQLDFYNSDRLNISSSVDNLRLGPVGQVAEISDGKFNILSITASVIVTLRESTT